MEADIWPLDPKTHALKARIAWLEEEEEQLGRTAYSAEQNGHVDEDARLRAEADRAEVRLELRRLKASLEAGENPVAPIGCSPNQQSTVVGTTRAMESETDRAEAEPKQASRDYKAGLQAGWRWAEEEDTGMTDLSVYLSGFRKGVLAHYRGVQDNADFTVTEIGNGPPHEQGIEKLIAAGFLAAARRAIRHAELSDKRRQQMLEEIAEPTVRFGTVVSPSGTAPWFGKIEDLTVALDCCTCPAGFEDAAGQIEHVIYELQNDCDDDDLDEDPIIGHLATAEWCLERGDRDSAKKIIDHLWRVGTGHHPLLELICE